MKQKTILILIFSLLIFPLINADIIIDHVDESSGVVIEKELDLELKNAIVNISVNEHKRAILTATFEIISNEDKEVNSRLYLKAKGQSCANWGCEDVDVTDYTTKIEMYYKPDDQDKIINPGAKNKNIPLIENEHGFEFYHITQEETIVIENQEGKFAGTQEFNLVPGETLVVEIEQAIILPFEYYLDSLSTFSKADYEKITIKGDNLNVQFNDKYPAKQISKNEWIWEYKNINTKDSNLNDILTISQSNNLKIPPEKSFFQKIISWFKKLF